MKRFTLDLPTEGNTSVHNLTPQLSEHLRHEKGDGLLHCFVVGSTAALTTVEFEPGLVKHDLKAVLQKLIPDDARYEHEATWNDDNGHSHIRAALIGPAITIPFHNSKLILGEYQQVALLDFDTRPRRRKIICTIMQ